jgi:hypothetical protein
MTADQQPWPDELREIVALVVEGYENALLPGDLDDIPADTERPSVEAMLDELVGERGHFVFFTARPAYTAVDIWRDPDSVDKPSGGPLADVSRPDWRSALREAYEQAVGQADGGERG